METLPENLECVGDIMSNFDNKKMTLQKLINKYDSIMLSCWNSQEGKHELTDEIRMQLNMIRYRIYLFFSENFKNQS